MEALLGVYLVCIMLACSCAYNLGWAAGNQKGYEECSKIWQKDYLDEYKRRGMCENKDDSKNVE